LHAKKPKDIMKKDLLVELEEMQKEVDYWMNEFNEKKEVFPEKELIYFEIRPQHSIKSALINKISEKFPNKTIVLVQDFGEEHVYFSARRQDFKVKVNDLLEKSIFGIPDSTAGGHIPAAAGKIPREYLKEFKKKLIELA
jgi:single-stranded DNA-specific DHH superfamily exonuclease